MLHQVVSLSGGQLGSDLAAQFGDRNMVNNHGNAVSFSPLLGEGIEPLVVAGNEVVPLEDPQLTGFRRLLSIRLSWACA